jgi:hypothetical protein
VLYADTEGKNVVTDIEISGADFKDFSGVMLPQRITYRWFNNAVEKKPVVVVSSSLRIESCEIGRLGDSNEEFYVVWPERTLVLDERNGRTVTVQGAAQRLTDAVLSKGYGVKVGARPQDGLLGSKGNETGTRLDNTNRVPVSFPRFIPRWGEYN